MFWGAVAQFDHEREGAVFGEGGEGAAEVGEAGDGGAEVFWEVLGWGCGVWEGCRGGGGCGGVGRLVVGG